MTIEFDARTDGLSTDGEAPLRVHATDPSGRTLSVNRWHLILDDEPFPVVAGELLPQRYPREEWDDAVRSVRDAGCTMVSSYVFWSLVEPEPGRFDFTGSNDIGAFAQICASYGLAFSPRIGPFNNSEYLVGGLPPWLFGMGVIERSNDERYLTLVRRYFAALAEQLNGLYFADGGPIIVVQLENELSHAPNDWSTLFGYTASEHRGPEGQAFTEHMTRLRSIAMDVGIDPPVFTMTGWRTAGEVPEGQFLPSYSAYMDLHPRPGPNSPLTTFAPGDYPYRGTYPVAFCEMGTGSPHRAAYRSRTSSEMTLTTATTRMGSVESIYLGYYLFHGGTNPVRGDGFGWTPKEPEFAQRSYDFWAPVSEFGERRDTFYALTPLNHLVREFGRELATLAVVDPQDPVIDADDDRVRASLRGAGSRGFVFLSNYGNNTPMSDRDDVRISVRTDDGEVEFPKRYRLRVPSGRNLVLPVGLDLGAGVRLDSATAQPIARLGTDVEPVVVFGAHDEAAEYVIDGEAVLVSPGEPLVVQGPRGRVRLVTLTWTEAEHGQVHGHGDDKFLVTSPDDITVDDDVVTVSRRRRLDATGGATSSVRIVTSSGDIVAPVELPQPSLHADAIRIETISPSRALLHAADDANTEDLWAEVSYTGDLCRLFDAGTGRLEADNFHHGLPWRVKLGRFGSALAGGGVQLRAEPVARKEAVVDPDGLLLDSVIRTDGTAASIDGIELWQRVTAVVDIPLVELVEANTVDPKEDVDE